MTHVTALCKSQEKKTETLLETAKMLKIFMHMVSEDLSFQFLVYSITSSGRKYLCTKATKRVICP